jgi:hypothetical protein
MNRLLWDVLLLALALGVAGTTHAQSDRFDSLAKLPLE